MPINKNRIDYFELKRKLKFVSRPMFEFCGAYVNYLDSFYGLNKNDPKINLLCSKQGLYNEVMNAFETELSPYVKREIEAFSFCNILQSVLKAFLFDYKSINSFDAFLKKYDSYKIEGLFDFIGGCFINEHLQSNCEDWPSSDLKAMAHYIEKSEDIDADAKKKVLDLYAYPEEAKMRIRYIIVSMYRVFKKFETDTLEQAKKQLKRYMNLMEIDYDYFCHILKFDDLTEVISNNEHIDLCISYMFTVSYFCKDYSDGTVLLLNGFLCDEYLAAKLEQHSVENFLSIIGDKQCREILMCYVERPYYLLELSRELSIAPQKLRMYNKRFLDAALIDFEHKGGRRYYRLNEDEFDKQFEMCKKLFK